MTGYAQEKPVPRNKPHWYLTHIDYCPACGGERTEKTRMPGKRPKDYRKRFIFEEHWDYCDL